jgi:hypothetical protein
MIVHINGVGIEFSSQYNSQQTPENKVEVGFKDAISTK